MSTSELITVTYGKKICDKCLRIGCNSIKEII